MEKNNFVYDLEFDWILGNRLKQNAEKEKVVVNNIEGQNFQMIVGLFFKSLFFTFAF